MKIFDVKPSNSFLVILLSLVSVLCISYTWQEEVVGLVGDDAIYLLLADYFSPYDSAARAGAAFIMNFNRFPPLYPLLLAVAGAGSKHILTAHLVTALCIITAAALYWWWLVEEGVDRYFALALSGLFLSLPGTMLLALDLWSEHFYLALTLLCLHLARRARKTGTGWFGVTVVASLVPLARSAGMTFAAALWIYFVIRKVPNRWRLMVISGVPMMIWTLISLQFEPYVSYTTTLADFLPRFASHDFLLPIVEFQIHSMWQGWHANFDFLEHTYSAVAPGLLLPFIVMGWWSRFRNAQWDALYLAPYLAMLILWPAQNHMARLLYVVMPFMLYYGLTGFGMMIMKYSPANSPPIPQTLFLVLLLLSSAPSSAQILVRRLNPPDPSLAAYAASAAWVKPLDAQAAYRTLRFLKHFVAVFRDTANYVEPDQCVFTIYAEQFMFYAHRLAFPPPNLDVSQEEFDTDMSRCRYVEIFWVVTHPIFPPTYPLSRLKQREEFLLISKMSSDPDARPVTGLLQLR